VERSNRDRDIANWLGEGLWLRRREKEERERKGDEEGARA